MVAAGLCTGRFRCMGRIGPGETGCRPLSRTERPLFVRFQKGWQDARPPVRLQKGGQDARPPAPARPRCHTDSHRQGASAIPARLKSRDPHVLRRVGLPLRTIIQWVRFASPVAAELRIARSPTVVAAGHCTGRFLCGDWAGSPAGMGAAVSRTERPLFVRLQKGGQDARPPCAGNAFGVLAGAGLIRFHFPLGGKGGARQLAAKVSRICLFWWGIYIS